LSVRLDFKARALSCLWPLLELPDMDLIEALGGRRRAELHRAYDDWRPASPRSRADVQEICLHNTAYPESLRENALAPHTLDVRGGTERLVGLLDKPVVAIVGTRRASDYGMEVARGLARGLATCGVTVASGLAEGIPSAVHAGALEADAASLTLMSAGVERCSPVWCGSLYRRILDRGSAISEVQRSSRPHDWWQAARTRTLALLARLVIVVEARDTPWELACAHIAQSQGKIVGAVPGRVSSPTSRGTNALIVDDVRLVRNPQDALDLLYGVGTLTVPSGLTDMELEPRLRRMLERVADGDDTVAKLTAHGWPAADTALALTELELLGALLRGDGGRYIPSIGRPA
jgi:DNA processing protein